MTYRKLLMALSIAAMFIVATSYPHMGGIIELTTALSVSDSFHKEEVVRSWGCAPQTFPFYWTALLPSSLHIRGMELTPFRYF